MNNFGYRPRMNLFELLFQAIADREPTPYELQSRLNSQGAEQAKLRVDAVVAIRKLAQENDRLRLYCASLARLLIQKGVIAVPEISAMLDIVDVEDGIPDGKLTGRLLPGEKPRPAQKPTKPKPVGKVPRRPKQPLAKPPAGWKPKGSAK